jgi:excisionase family DNA binding protein
METKFKNRIITVQEAAYLLHLSDATVCKIIRLGYLSARKKGREWQITEASVYAFIEANWPKSITES